MKLHGSSLGPRDVGYQGPRDKKFASFDLNFNFISLSFLDSLSAFKFQVSFMFAHHQDIGPLLPCRTGHTELNSIGDCI